MPRPPKLETDPSQRNFSKSTRVASSAQLAKLFKRYEERGKSPATDFGSKKTLTTEITDVTNYGEVHSGLLSPRKQGQSSRDSKPDLNKFPVRLKETHPSSNLRALAAFMQAEPIKPPRKINPSPKASLHDPFNESRKVQTVFSGSKSGSSGLKQSGIKSAAEPTGQRKSIRFANYMSRKADRF